MMQALKNLTDYAFGADLSGYKSKLYKRITALFGEEFAEEIIKKNRSQQAYKIIMSTSATIAEVSSILSFYETHNPRNLIPVAICEALRFIIDYIDRKDNSELEQLIDKIISKRRS